VRLVLEILNYLFNPDLTDGQPEVRTFDGTERRDIVLTNESDEAFWDYVRTSHDNIFIMFETKNTDELDAPAIGVCHVRLHGVPVSYNQPCTVAQVNTVA
jgi:hypothetical protein